MLGVVVFEEDFVVEDVVCVPSSQTGKIVRKLSNQLTLLLNLVLLGVVEAVVIFLVVEVHFVEVVVGSFLVVVVHFLLELVVFLAVVLVHLVVLLEVVLVVVLVHLVVLFVVGLKCLAFSTR